MEDAHIGDRTITLRAEELAFDATPVREGEAAVSRAVVSTNVRFDLSLLAEDASVAYTELEPPYRTADPIVGPQRLVVRLSRERAFVGLRVVEYERVAVGTRAVTDSVRVAARLLHDELAIDAPAADPT
ncbi:MAG: hypothetical protein NVS2B3_12870 [Vulcanimicrobiaceae bacterium]